VILECYYNKEVTPSNIQYLSNPFLSRPSYLQLPYKFFAYIFDKKKKIGRAHV